MDLSSLPPEEREQARRMMEIAKRAEERARARERQSSSGKMDVEGDDEHGDTTKSEDKAETASEKASKQPLSIEDILKKRKEEGSRRQQLTFLTKEQRQKLAQERLEARRKEAEARREAARKQREEFIATMRNGSSTGRSTSAHSSDSRPRFSRSASRDGRGGGRGGGGGARDSARDSRAAAAPVDRAKLLEEREAALASTIRGEEVDAIKAQYLGQSKERRRVVKPSEKYTRIFQFEWDAAEDTSVDFNPIYANRMEPTLLFGRGYRAGIDMRTQRESSRFMEALLDKRRQLEAQLARAEGEMSGAERREREAEHERLLAQIREAERRMDEKVSRAGLGEEARHWSEKTPAEMSERDWRIFREDHDIRIKGGRAANPIRSWAESSIDERLMRAIRDAGYEKPTPIQMQAIPIGQRRRDIMGIAETGSGKTAAFVIPMVEYILGLPARMRDRVGEDGPLALIMAPTRELALQIEEEVKKLGEHSDVRVAAMVGGHSVHDQGVRVRRGVDVVIATPGRLTASLESQHLVLNQCNYIVLDEADRMIDMGFEHSVTVVLDAMGSLLKSEAEEEAAKQEAAAASGDQLYRTTVMFSATMPPSVERLARQYLRCPAIVSIGDEESSHNKRISQRVIMTTEPQKLRILQGVVAGAEPPIIIFVNIKRNCDMVARSLEQNGFSAVVLHGGKGQEQRETALTMFKEKEVDILVATDVAGRGLDIPGVQHVINYDMASTVDKYCHRIGRTGRAGAKGASTTFLTEDDSEVFYDLTHYLQATGQEVPNDLLKHPASKIKPGDAMLSKKDARMFGV